MSVAVQSLVRGLKKTRAEITDLLGLAAAGITLPARKKHTPAKKRASSSPSARSGHGTAPAAGD